MADPVADAIARFRASPSQDEATKLDALAALEEHDDPRVLPFLLEMVRDPDALDVARVEICEILAARDGDDAQDRAAIARTLAKVLADDDADDVRGYAANALGSYLDQPGARDAIAKVVLDRVEPRTVRHNALFAIERGGPHPESEKVLRQLDVDPDLGRAARRVLGEWDPDRDSDDDGDD